MSFKLSGSNHRKYACLHLLYELDLKNDDGIIPLPCKSSLSSLISSHFQILVGSRQLRKLLEVSPSPRPAPTLCILHPHDFMIRQTSSCWNHKIMLIGFYAVTSKRCLKCSLFSLLHCWWEYKLVQPLQRTLWRFLLLL